MSDNTHMHPPDDDHRGDCEYCDGTGKVCHCCGRPPAECLEPLDGTELELDACRPCEGTGEQAPYEPEWCLA